MSDCWVLQETKGLDLKDERLNARFREVLSKLGRRPSASIPEALGGRAETTAAYRLFDNEKATFDQIIAPHAQATRSRMAAQSTVLLVQDTTEIDLTRPNSQVQGAGPLAGGKRQGMLVHALHAMTPDGTPLGTLRAKYWTRDPSREPNRKKERSERAATPIEEKESYRWLEMQRSLRQEAMECPETRLIGLCDSESDIYEVFAESGDVDWIIRSGQDRAVLTEESASSKQTARLRERLMEEDALYSETIEVRARKARISCEDRARRKTRKSRSAHITVRSTRVTLRPPWRSDRKLPPLEVNVVLVLEEEPPKDMEPIEWLLLTTLPITSEEQVRTVVEHYGTRWMIEIFFRVLKSGCHVEKRRLETLERVLTCLATYLIIAWRTLYACRLARSQPDLSCQTIWEPSEWKAAWTVCNRTEPPKEPPKLADMVLIVAELGGYVRRKSPPGPQTIWIGMQRVRDFAICWETFGPGAST